MTNYEIVKEALAAMSAEETEAYIREQMRVCLNRYVGHPVSEKNKADMVKEIKKSMYEVLKTEGRHHISIKLSEDGKSILWKSKKKKVKWDDILAKGFGITRES